MYQKLTNLLFLLLTFSLSSYSQTEFDFDLSNNCSYYGEKIENKVYSFSSSQEAINEIEKILYHIGLKKNFQVNAANVPNAAAVIQGSTRYILYSQNFINQVNTSTNTKWAAVSILAHELGHHLNGHTLDNTGSRPPIELEADEFSGFVLSKMGASLEEAQIAMNQMGSTSLSLTHPPKSARLEAIAVGWNRAKESSGSSTTTNNESGNINTSNTTPPAIPSSSTNNVEYISKCIFNGDPYQYYVTNTNVIVGFNPFTNQSAIIGQKQPSADSRFAWIYVTSSVMYGVDVSGSIWSQNHLGQPVKVGYVTFP